MAKAQVFTKTNFGGSQADLDEGVYNLGDGTGSVGDDTIASLKVESGYQIEAYTDPDCHGNSRTYRSDEPDLGDFAGAISSVKVEAIRRVSVAAVPDSVVLIQPPPVE